MTSLPIVSRLQHYLPRFGFFAHFSRLTKPPDLHTLWLGTEKLPDFVRESPVAMRYLELLGPLAWDRFPERNLQRNWGRATVPLSAFAGACLVKVDQQIGSLARLRTYLVEHPPPHLAARFSAHTVSWPPISSRCGGESGDLSALYPDAAHSS